MELQDGGLRELRGSVGRNARGADDASDAFRLEDGRDTDVVHIPFIAKLVADGKFQATADHEKAAGAMLDELLRWTEALASLRTPR